MLNLCLRVPSCFGKVLVNIGLYIIPLTIYLKTAEFTVSSSGINWDLADLIKRLSFLIDCSFGGLPHPGVMVNKRPLAALGC